MPTTPVATGLRILSGDAVSDTAHARLGAPLVVEFRNSSGSPMANVAIDFDPEGPQDAARPLDSDFRISTEEQGVLATSLRIPTDANGVARVYVRFGKIAGQARIRVRTSSFSAEANYTVLPGATTSVVPVPRDTVLGFSRTLRLSVRVIDAYGNDRPDAATYATVGPISSTTAGSLTAATTMGLGKVVVSAGPAIDTAFVSVVPPIRIAAIQDGGQLVLAWLDNSSVRKTLVSGLAVPFRRNVCWSSDGARVLLERPGIDGNRLVAIDTNGLVSDIVPPPINAGEEYPSCVRQRNAVWFAASDTRLANQGLTIWRVNLDGSGHQQLGPYNNQFTTFTDPSPSTNETRAVFLSSTYPSYNVLHTLDLGSGAPIVTNLNITAWGPRWSPVDDLIAFGTPTESSSGGPIWTMRPDGSDRKQVTAPGDYYWSDLEFTGDGQWLLTKRASTQDLAFVNVITGQRLNLRGTANLRSPSMRP